MDRQVQAAGTKLGTNRDDDIVGRREALRRFRELKAAGKRPESRFEGGMHHLSWTEETPVPADGKVNGCDCGAVKSGSCPNQCS